MIMLVMIMVMRMIVIVMIIEPFLWDWKVYAIGGRKYNVNVNLK